MLRTKRRPITLVFGQCTVAGLFPLQRLEETKKRKTVENAFLVDQCTKVVNFLFVLFVCWFSLIRTKAFSVFSEVSHCAATLW